MANREAALRRVAIVLSSLPPAVAANLMTSIEPSLKKLVRRAMTNLSDVDPLERRRALAAFKGMVTQSQMDTFTRQNQSVDKASVGTRDDHSDIGHTANVVKRLREDSFDPKTDNDTSNHSPLSFLSDVEDDSLVEMLSLEHPQAVALVLASISPAQAARIIPRLDPAIQSESLSRIGRLGDVPKEAVEELATHLRTRVEQHAQQQNKTTGQRALSAILAAMPNGLSQSQGEMQPLTEAKPQRDASPQRDAYVPTSSATDQVEKETEANANLKHIEVHSLRVAPGTSPTPQEVEKETHSGTPQSTIQGADADEFFAPGAAVLDSTDATHQFLVKLSGKQLCQALGKVQTRQVLLALCGLPNEVCDQALSFLPRAQAKQVRTQMISLESVQLRDIDDAKTAVAKAALQQESNSASSMKRTAMAA
ncbi:Flagellar motor switch protein FliG [Planctomycetes bacterium CA13]|uniref:Flagellar motor switch protein FliG n=1 Tax=Novipirellula herctigrandis TaxID=2527986 RepID=A0A5C5Z7T1_9BACT|nr:Flagellar motor switch protein FliG [Planctomycetes bacterium CA13]